MKAREEVVWNGDASHTIRRAAWRMGHSPVASSLLKATAFSALGPLLVRQLAAVNCTVVGMGDRVSVPHRVRVSLKTSPTAVRISRGGFLSRPTDKRSIFVRICDWKVMCDGV